MTAQAPEANLKPIRILFVCMGNICRSPMAEAVFKALAKTHGIDRYFEVASAGTVGWHEGRPANQQTEETLSRHGFDLEGFRSRPVSLDDFAHFHYILAMDRDNERDLLRMCPSHFGERVGLFLSLAPRVLNEEVPDPYDGTDDDFEHAFGLIEAGCEGMITTLKTFYPALTAPRGKVASGR
ncbi:MAG: low molecular weight protein-tyrosine-phosphatase [Pseudomonadota bacterium]